MQLIYFRTEWCAVCHARAPVAERIAREAALPLEVVDTEREGGAARAAALRIRQVPTLALVDVERVRFRLVGSMITPETAAHLLARIPTPPTAGERSAHADP